MSDKNMSNQKKIEAYTCSLTYISMKFKEQNIGGIVSSMPLAQNNNKILIKFEPNRKMYPRKV